MVCPAIDNSASCKICTVIGFLRAKNMIPAEMHHESCMVCSQNVTTERTERQWCRMSNDGLANKCSQ
jgi:hypothetical protein